MLNRSEFTDSLKISIIYIFLEVREFMNFCRLKRILVVFRPAGNGLVLGEEADFEALNC
jgi:hypothetical protein